MKNNGVRETSWQSGLKQKKIMFINAENVDNLNTFEHAHKQITNRNYVDNDMSMHLFGVL